MTSGIGGGWGGWGGLAAPAAGGSSFKLKASGSTHNESANHRHKISRHKGTTTRRTNTEQELQVANRCKRATDSPVLAPALAALAITLELAALAADFAAAFATRLAGFSSPLINLMKAFMKL